MALQFTNEQIKNITKDILLIPFLIDDPINGTGYVQQKENVQVLKDSIMQTDSELKVFSDSHINNISNYHKVYEAITTDKRSDYSEAMLQEGGKQQPPHFESDPIWVNLIPKLRPENTGLPISNPNPYTEVELINRINNPINALKNGFSFGSFNDNATNITGTTFSVEDETGINVNDEGMLLSGNDFAYIKIDSITPSSSGTSGGTTTPVDAVLSYTVLGGTSGAMADGSFRNYQTGFSNADRGRQSGISGPDLAIMEMFEQSIVDAVDAWKSNLTIQKTALDSADDGARRTIVEDASDKIGASISEIGDWEVMPIANVNGKFTDFGLDKIIDAGTSRQTESNELKASLETTLLGVLTQNADGTFDGSGSYYDLFNFVSLRISKGTGTLFQYYQADMAIALFDKKIADANSRLAQYKNTFALVKILSDTVIGQIEFDCEAPSEFSIGDNIFIMDNDSIVFSRVITNINGSNITLDNGVPAELKVNSLARIARQK